MKVRVQITTSSWSSLDCQPYYKTFFSIWYRFKTTHGFQSPHNPLLSFLRNPSFYPAWDSPNSFSPWSNTNLMFLHKLHKLTFWETYGLPKSELFWYLQIKNFYMPYLNTGSLLTQMSQFKRICKSDPHIKGLISILYKQLSVKPDSGPPSYVTKWEQDLGRTFDIADWSGIWAANKSSLPNVLAIETNYKVLARWYT